MRGIDQFQQWSASTELNLVFVEQINRARDALTVDDCAVEAFQIDDRELTVGASYLGMAAGNHRGGCVDDYVAFRIATEPKYVFVQFEPASFCRLGID